MNEQKKDVLFNPFPKQIEFLEAAFSGKYDFILYGGAIRGGKTFAVLGLFVMLCRFFPGSRWALVRKDLQTLKKNTFPSWDKMKPSSWIVKHDRDTQTVTFKNGSQIIFFGENYADDPELNRFKGLEVNGFGFEEINECREKTLNKAFERAGAYIIPNTDKQPKPLIVATCNPTQNWVKDRVFDKWQAGELPKTWVYIQSKITDNPYIPAEYLRSLQENMTYADRRVFMDGDWNYIPKDGSEFYKCFNERRQVVAVKYDPSLPLHISFDENVNPYMTLTVYQYKEIGARKIIKQIDEFCLEAPKNRVSDICRAFAAKYVGHDAGVFVYGDATSQKDDAKLEKGFNFYKLIALHLKEFSTIKRVSKANPSVVMRGNFINSVFEFNFDGIEVYISPDCKNSILDFNNLKEDADGSKKKQMETNPDTKVRFQSLGHTSDTFDYFICYICRTAFDRFQRGEDSQGRKVVDREIFRVREKSTF